MDAARITPNTSYARLKAMVEDRTEDDTPKGKTLIKSGEPVLIKVEENGKTITVYKNGFFAYQVLEDGKERVTARAVWNCSELRYKDALGNITTVSEEFFSDLPFPIVLAHFGDRNIEWQIEEEKRKQQSISLDGGKVNLHGSGKEGVKRQLDQGLITPDFSEEGDRRLDGDDEVDTEQQRALVGINALASLKEKQRRAFILHHRDGMTYEQISKIIGGDKSSVCRLLQRAEKKLEKVRQEKTTTF